MMLLALVWLAPVVACPQEGASSGSAVRPTETADSEVLEILELMLEDARVAQNEADFETAREILRAVFEEDVWDRMVEAGDVTAFAGIELLEPLCASLGMPDLTGVVRRHRVERLSATLPADHGDLILAQEKLGHTLRALGDIQGASALFERVHAWREQRLPPDHSHLLIAKLNLGLARRDLGDLEGAGALFELVHAGFEQLHSADHPNTLTAEQALAVTRRDLGDYEGALPLFEHVHEVRSQQLSPEHRDLLVAKENLAVVRNDLGDLRGAHDLFEQVHAARQRDHPATHSDLLRAKQNLGSTTRALGDLEGARALFAHVLATREQLLPADHPDLLASKQNLAVVYRDLREFEEALALEEQVLAGAERTLPPDHPSLLKAKENIGNTLRELGDIPAARAHFESVHAARARILASDHPLFVRAEENMAVVLSDMGELEAALALSEHVNATRERQLPAYHPDLLRGKSSLAITRAQLGDLVGAHEMLEQVHAARESSLPGDHLDLLRTKENLAATRRTLHDFDGALALYEHVHEAYRRLLPPDHLDLFTVKLGLANAHMGLGDLEAARVLFEEVHSAFREALAPDHPRLLLAAQNLGSVRRELGDLAGAQELFEYVLAARERSLHADHLELIAAKECLAVIRHDRGALEEALVLFEEVNAARERLLAPDHPDLLRVRESLSATRRDLGDMEGSLEVLGSLLASQLVLAERQATESPRVARTAAREELDRLARCCSWVNATSNSHGPDALGARFFSVLENLRLVSTASSRIALATRKIPALAGMVRRVSQARRELSDLSLAPPEEVGRVPAWQSQLQRLADERDRYERDLRMELDERGVAHQLVHVQDIAQGLEPGAAWFSFFRHTEPAPGLGRSKGHSLLAFVVRPNASIACVPLGPMAAVEELVASWRRGIGEPLDSEGGSASKRGIGHAEQAVEAEDHELGRRLCEMLIDPCMAVLEAPPTALHLVLDDVLHLIPFDALTAEDGRRLGEVCEVRIETSVLRLIRSNEGPRSGGFVSVGGVDYSADLEATEGATVAVATPPLTRSGDRNGAGAFQPLSQARVEAEALSLLYEELLEDDPVLLTGAKATKAALHELAPRARYLHIATHGWFAPETFESQVDAAEQETVRNLLRRAEDTIVGFAPETLCGLAFAGANHGMNRLGKVPGIMTAEELATLDLSRCELAVLSACETNVGIRRAGQGVQSLQTALHAAGARTAITSLWRVDDAATRHLMELFYAKLWKDELGKARALWQAKMGMREEGYPIRDWAGWVLTGDPD